ncbi:MAG: DNA polymerase III subunit chi [Xanthomonadales bacterium]|nr:DNA polymerase III subunit chi [Xanthomonadales bacterium]
MSETCQVDFYILARPTQSAGELACRLAMKAWTQGHSVIVCAESTEQAERLDELMWDCPPGRFLPHQRGEGEAPVGIVTQGEELTREGDLVINLTTEPVPEPSRFRRLLEIVPVSSGRRDASREKYRTYREQGLSPETHKMG